MSITSDREFVIALRSMAQLKSRLSQFEEVAKPLEVKLETLKFEVMQHMQKTKSKRTEPVGGFYAIRTERKGFNVKDEKVVAEWLAANNFKLDEYLHLDKAMVKATAEGVFAGDGKIIPGVEETMTEYLTIKEEKK